MILSSLWDCKIFTLHSLVDLTDISLRLGNTKDAVVLDIKRMLREGLRSHQVSLYGLELDQGKLPLKKIAELLAKSVAQKRSDPLGENHTDKVQFEALPRTITFPYSRHSSFAELCDLVRVFDPMDVYPCTVDEEDWDEGISSSFTSFKLLKISLSSEMNCPSQLLGQTF